MHDLESSCTLIPPCTGPPSPKEHEKLTCGPVPARNRGDSSADASWSASESVSWQAVSLDREGSDALDTFCQCASVRVPCTSGPPPLNTECGPQVYVNSEIHGRWDSCWSPGNGPKHQHHRSDGTGTGPQQVAGCFARAFFSRWAGTTSSHGRQVFFLSEPDLGGSFHGRGFKVW